MPIRYEPEFAVGEPTRLFEGAYTTDRAPDYDVSRDGRFLMIREVGDDTSTPAHLVIVQSWFEDLEARVPTGQE